MPRPRQCTLSSRLRTLSSSIVISDEASSYWTLRYLERSQGPLWTFNLRQAKAEANCLELVAYLGGSREIRPLPALLLAGQRPKRRFEGAEPRFEGPPARERLAEDGPAHLLRTRTTHGPVGLEEAQARFLERQSEIVEQLADFAFGIGHQRLVIHPTNEPRQRGVEMRHQRDVIREIAAELGKLVAEFLAPGEMMREVGEAAGHGAATHVHDLGLRQDQMNEPGMKEIVRHLVDEEGPLGAAMDARLLQIGGAQRARRRGGEHAHGFRIAPRLLVEPARDADHLLQLGGAFHLGVAGQHLLDQGRTRARQAHDEDGIGGLCAVAFALGEEFAGEHRLAARHQRGGRGRVMREAGAPQRVALGIVLEGLGMAALVLQRLAQREIEPDAILLAEISAPDLRAHALGIARSETEGLEIGEAAPGFAEIGLERERLALALKP